MPGSYGLAASVILGLTVGVAIVIIFSIGFQTKSTKPANFVTRIAIVTIPANNTSEGGCDCFDPKIIKVAIGANNTVRWVNEDSLPYTIASDTDYKDPTTGIAFGTEARSDQEGGQFIMPGKYYEFTFREPGSFGYHSIPHPELKGQVIVYSNIP
jgi:plastocyanin